MPKLGILVVGQSPRPEVEQEFRRLIDDVDLDLRGCLDGLSRQEISDIQPITGENTLFTRLPSGEGVRLSKKAVIHHGETQLDGLEKSGAQAVVVLCTGEFPMWADRRILVPSEILKNVVLSVQPMGHLGVLSPLASQIPNTLKRWSAHGHKVTAVDLSPNASPEEVAVAGNKLSKAAPDLVVLDCVSYTKQTKDIISKKVSCPSVLAITTIARIAAEILE